MSDEYARRVHRAFNKWTYQPQPQKRRFVIPWRKHAPWVVAGAIVGAVAGWQPVEKTPNPPIGTVAQTHIPTKQSEAGDNLTISNNIAYNIVQRPNDAPPAKNGVRYRWRLSADNRGIVRWSVAQGVLPNGLTLRSEGVVVGTPIDARTECFTLHGEHADGTLDVPYCLSVR